MVTGDFKLTAEAIAKQVGILSSQTVHSFDEMKQQQSFYDHVATLPKTDLKPVEEEEQCHGLVLDGKDVLCMTEGDWDVLCKYYS